MKRKQNSASSKMKQKQQSSSEVLWQGPAHEKKGKSSCYFI